MSINWPIIYKKFQLSKVKYPFYEGRFDYADYEGSKIARRLPKTRVGWGSRAVEIRANKTHFDRFENDTLGLTQVFDKYRGREAFDKVKEDILVCGVGFLAVTGRRLMPFTAMEATGTFDWYEQNLQEGIAVFKESEKKNPLLPVDTTPPLTFGHFTPEQTIFVEDGVERIIRNITGRPMMAMLTHKSTTRQPFGRTVLTAPARDAIIDASRTRRQATIASYHYNRKVDVILGVDSETTVDTVEAQAGDILKIGTNEAGQIPQIGEFAQHALAPFSDSILMAARDFCAATKLTLNNLSLGSQAPQSPEALEIIGDDLRDDIREWQRELGEQLKYIAVTLWMAENNVNQLDESLIAKIEATTASWMPVFRADVSKFGDGLTKIAEKAPAIVTQRSIWRNLGLTSAEIDNVTDSTADLPK